MVTNDKDYIQGIKIYNTGIKEDPVPGEKRGKGVQHLNSSYWVMDLGCYISKNIISIQNILKDAIESGEECQYLLNQSNYYFMKSENGGLRSQESKDYFLLASWLCKLFFIKKAWHLRRLINTTIQNTHRKIVLK